MATTLDNTTLAVSLAATLNQSLKLQAGGLPINYARTLGLSNGSGAGQADRIWADTRTLAASALEDLDLAGTLVDGFGQVITLARVKAIVIAAAGANANNLVVGGAAANAFVNWVGAATHTITVRPGGLFVLASTDAVGYAVTAGTGDLLRVTNGGAGTAVTYDIVVIGSSV